MSGCWILGSTIEDRDGTGMALEWFLSRRRMIEPSHG